MDELLENLWICPICSAEHLQPVIVCYRCGCQILLLNKIKFLAKHYQELGYQELSHQYHHDE